MSNTKQETDVLIVGAGPVGLFLGNECARRGLRWRLVEKNAGQSQHSKALAIFPRTLEVFDMAGVSGRFLELANRVTSVSVTTQGRVLAHMRFHPEESIYPFIAMVPQDVTEKLLLEELVRKGGVVEYETAFVTAVESDGGVTATLDHNGEISEVRAAFVVGCDGAHSAVRHLLNLSFEGAEYKDSFILADIESNEGLPVDELQLCPNELGPVAIFPMSATRRRVVATVQEVEANAPSLDLVRRIVAERGPEGLEVRALHWSSYFRIHHRQVAQLRVGRMFVAGDAAHIHSPFGGQGMNTGLQDVWNLAWKLDLAVRGYGNQELLDSYSAERRPVIKSVIESTDLMTRALGTPSKLAQVLRNAMIPMVSRLAPFQHAFVQRLSELGVAYRGSPIVEGAGERYFDESLRGGERIRSRFVLLVGDKVDEATKEAAAEFASSFSEVLELRSRSGDKITLIRPDGYVAYSGSRQDGVGALQAIQELLEPQTSLRDERRAA